MRKQYTGWRAAISDAHLHYVAGKKKALCGIIPLGKKVEVPGMEWALCRNCATLAAYGPAPDEKMKKEPDARD